jgi:hypothetical protein
MTAEKFAQMPNCNLAKSIQNKWLQASGHKGGDLYVATVDDYIQAFLQVVAMALANKNSSFYALNVNLNIIVTRLFYKRFFSTCPAGENFAPKIPTLRMMRFSDRKNASP